MELYNRVLYEYLKLIKKLPWISSKINLFRKFSMIRGYTNNQPFPNVSAVNQLISSDLFSERTLCSTFNFKKFEVNSSISKLIYNILISNIEYTSISLQEGNEMLVPDDGIDSFLILKKEKWQGHVNYHIFVKDVEQFKKYIYAYFWKDSNFIEFIIDKDNNYVVRNKELSENIESDVATNISKQLGTVNRSYLFYGEPGVGKSYSCKYIVKKHNLRTIFLPIEKINAISNSMFCEIIDIFAPDAMVIDDIDRLGDNAKMLAVLEEACENVKLFMASANNISNLDKALLRPGRFDSIIEIKNTDKNVILSILGIYHKYLDELVCFPAAYVKEYVKLRNFNNNHEDSLKQVRYIYDLVNPKVNKKAADVQAADVIDY